MSATIVVGAIGVAASVYSANQQAKAADKAGKAAQEAFARNQAIAEELKKRQETMVDKPLEQKIAELQSKKMSAAGLMSLDRFNAGMAAADRQIQEQAQQAGEGVTGARELTQQFRKAQGLAGLTLEDQANKDRNLAGYMSLASQTPGWAQVATGANTQQANYAAMQEERALKAEQSAYASAAQGLGNIATGLYGMYGNRPDPSSTQAMKNYSAETAQRIQPMVSRWDSPYGIAPPEFGGGWRSDYVISPFSYEIRR